MNMKNKNILFAWLAAFCLLLLPACGDSHKDTPWIWDDDGPEEPDTPGTDDGKPLYVWIDAGGNFERFADSRDNIRADLERLSGAGVTDIIVDVRPTTGDVLFRSSVADPVTRMDVWNTAGYVWVSRTATWDYLQAFIDEGHALGLRVHASINTFTGGYLCPYGLGSEGMLFRDASKREWATVLNAEGGPVNTMDLTDDGTDYGAKFLNPANDEVQEFVLALLGELAAYDLDGIILDRCRYSDDGLMADFSDESRRKFEQCVGHEVDGFPAAVLAPGWAEGVPAAASEYFKPWLEFRARVIHDFIVRARERVKAVNPQIRFGAYVGAWYSTYYVSGVNWAGPKYNPAADYPAWASAGYRETGYADQLDYLFIGAYAAADRIHGTGEWTVEGFCRQAVGRVAGACPVIGGVDIGNSSGWTDGGQGARIPEVIGVCTEQTDGCFLFDLCHIRMYDYWANLKN